MATPRACSLLLLLTLTTAIRCQQPLNCTDILEENARQKAEIKWLNNVITNNISQLAAMIQDNAEAIQENTEKVYLVDEKATANEENIQGNIGAILDNTDNIGITAEE